MRTVDKKTIIIKHGAKRLNKRGKKKFGGWQLAALIFVVVIALFWTVVALTNSGITTSTQTISIPGLPSSLEGYTILQLTDLNAAEIGKNQEKLVKAIKAVSYDAICMTGDMIGKSGNVAPLLDLLDQLKTTKPIMFITGDGDPSPLADKPDAQGALYADYINQLKARGVTYIDYPHMLTVGDARIWFSSALDLNVNAKDKLAKLQQDYNDNLAQGVGGDKLSLAAYRLSCAQQLDSAAKGMQSGDIHIALCHVPLSDDFVRSLQYAEGKLSSDSQNSTATAEYLKLIDLALCGHYVGGQWRLPFVGALFIPDSRLPRGGWFPDQTQVSGLRRSNSVYIYTSTGLSSSCAYTLPSFRLFNMPEISVLKLTAQLGV